jgi:hypothetical protein
LLNRVGKSEQIHIALNASELAATDDYRFANRILTKCEAFRRLVEAGLGADVAKE